MELGEDDQRSIAHLLVDQVEFADVILINKTDLVSEAELKHLYGIIRSLNSDANIIETLKSQVPLDAILNTNSFDFNKAAQSPGWLKVMRGEESSETDEYGVSSISFDARKPFHPERFFNFLHTEFSGLYRAKGYFWIATQPDFMAEMAIAGTVREFHPSGYWWVTVNEAEWPQEEEAIAYIKQNWHPDYGDRSQKLVFIGESATMPAIEKALEQCLLTDDELKQDASLLQNMKDPFGDWNKLAQAAMNDTN